MNKKRTISILITIALMCGMLSVITHAAVYGTIAYTNKYTYVRSAPCWPGEHVVETLPANYQVDVLGRDVDYLYVLYTLNGVKKAGYLPMADVTGSYAYYDMPLYESVYNNTIYAAHVYHYCYESEIIGTIAADEGEVANKPLMVLREENGYSLVQYVTNPQNDGSSHSVFKRGWVLSIYLSYLPKTSLTTTQNTNKFYIRNVATGLYLDVQSYSINDGANIHVWEYHGGYNQEWILDPVTTSKGSTYVRLLTNMASAQNKGIQVASDAPILNSDITLLTKAAFVRMQFVIEPTSDGYYYIRSRRGANFFVLGVDPSDSGNGGEVYLKYPTSSLYNKWVLEAAYEENTHYFLKSATDKIQSNISDGVVASYNIESVSKDLYVNGRVIDFEALTNQSLSSWTSSGKKITTQGDNNSDDYIIWADAGGYAVDITGNPIGYTFGTSQIRSGNVAVVTMYYDAIYNYCINNSIISSLETVWKSTLVHELGHTLGLYENNFNYDSIMSQNRNRTIVVSPHRMDFSGVKKNYSLKK